MNLLPVVFPPGVFRSGTEYQSKSRWYDTNLVRWYDGVALGPILGWTTKSSSTATGKIRATVPWRDDSNNRWLGIGTHSKLYVMNDAGTLFDITPAGFTEGRGDAVANIGYGSWLYGSGTYGTPRPDSGSTLDATVWDLDLWGQYLVGCSPDDGKLYEWTLGTGTPAAQIANAPTGCNGLIVTPQRSLMAFGAGGNKRKYQWSDLENNTIWTPSSTNQAGDGEVPTGKIVCGRVIGDAVLMLSDVDAHLVEYVGLPFVYARRKVGDACGALSKRCIAVIGQQAVWWSQSGFWIFDGAARALRCDVWDDLQRNLNTAQKSKVSSFHNARNQEIWWFYPSSGSSENDSYVFWNYKYDYWGVGDIVRLAGSEPGVFIYPLLAGSDGYIYEHETGFSYGGASPFARSGPIELGPGDNVMDVLGIVPDESTTGEVTISFRTRFYPNAGEATVSETTLNSAGRADLRFAARQVAMVVTGSANSAWRFGNARLELRPGAER